MSGEAGRPVRGRRETRADRVAFGATAGRSRLSPRKSVAVVSAALGLVLALFTRTAGAWIEHEHEYVVLEAFARMLEEKPKEVSTLAEVSTAPRVGIGIEWHMPFFLLPLDLIPLAPIYLVDSASGGDLYFRIAARAAAGGAIARWQRIRSLGFLEGASWQIVLGREGTIAVYASSERRGSVDAADVVGLDNHGYTQIQLPILAMTGKHIYAGDLALDSRFRLGYDVSFREGETIHGIWLGWGFEVRRYFWRP